MVFSYYIYKIPFAIIYKIAQLLKCTVSVVFYCPELIDWEVFEPIQELIKDIPIITRDREVRNYFRKMNKKVYNFPIFPKAVIMCRHACHKFPASEIIKIGLRHGPYHFKKMTSAQNYNLFDLYLMTSRADNEAASAIGVKVGKAVGFPKLDPAFNSKISVQSLRKLADKAGIDPNKKTLLFTATWIESGMSALLKWHTKLWELTDIFNILVTLHPWIDRNYRQQITHQNGVYLVGREKTLPYIMLADFCIGDTSSILAECCALNKPLITFRIRDGRRSLPEIERILEQISIRIDNFDEILPAIDKYIDEPLYLEQERALNNKLMFDQLDGKASIRATEEICRLLPDLKLEEFIDRK